MGKKINILTAIFISNKSDIKTFLKWISNECPKGTRQYDQFKNYFTIVFLVFSNKRY